MRDSFRKEDVPVHTVADLLKEMEVLLENWDNCQNETADKIRYGELTDGLDKMMDQRIDNGEEEAEA